MVNKGDNKVICWVSWVVSLEGSLELADDGGMVLVGIGLAVGPHALAIVAHCEHLDSVGGRRCLDTFDLHSRKSLHDLVLERQRGTAQSAFPAKLDLDLPRHYYITTTISIQAFYA
jgi:hypothetical protein